MTEAAMSFEEHTKKAKAVMWHPIVENMMASYGEDTTVRIWDVNQGECAITFTGVDEPCHAIRWSPDGDLLGATVKKNTMAFFDPRVESSVIRAASHVGPRAQKISWIDQKTVVTAGFGPGANKEIAVWDLKNLEAPLAKADVPDGTGIQHIDFDREHNLLFTAGRGDSQIEFFQINKGALKIITYLDAYRAKGASKAFCWMPKWAVECTKHEVRRAARVTSDKTLENIAFMLPSKSGLFQPDLYPPFPSNTPNGKIDEWISGTNKPAITMELKPQKK